MDHVDRILAQWRAERPDLDVAPMGLLGRLKRLTDRVTEETGRVFRAHDLTPAGFDVLATLRRSGPPYALSPSSLISWTMVTSGTMTNRLDRLEAAGLVERRRDPEDGRGSLVALTDAGFALIEQVVAEHVANQHRIVASLPQEMRARLTADITEWLAHLDPPQDDDG
ncbi:MarR family transcriptional regulator [Roseobacter sp. HKCCA0434]|uniref:MarR family winged helix-turn-helix transcriptional regulator n=1 Tax=Roseobacter sp. HKCCA0434 TaxID=3079297 RepID=UPI002905F052|nr:MarR family transcriptional regulator [Roseobacter sp. HKCCA0434]